MSDPQPANTLKLKQRILQSTTAIRNDLVQQLTTTLGANSRVQGRQQRSVQMLMVTVKAKLRY